MKKYTENLNIQKDQTLERMLRDRKAPLTAEAMQRLLADLTMYIAGDVVFYAALYPRKEALDKTEIEAKDIEKADVMEGTDGERYLPVFTDPDRLKQWKPKFKTNEYIYIMEKKDLLDFLNINNKIAAAVANPIEDDLLLYRMQLQNMIKINADRHLF